MPWGYLIQGCSFDTTIETETLISSSTAISGSLKIHDIINYEDKSALLLITCGLLENC